MFGIKMKKNGANGDRNIPPRKISPGRFHPGGFPPRNIPPMRSMHGNNVVWLCAKYAVDACLFRLESLILTRATNLKNVGWNIP